MENEQWEKFYILKKGEISLTEEFKTALNTNKNYENWQQNQPLPQIPKPKKIGELFSLENIFLGCNGIKSLNLSNWDMRYIKNTSAMFRQCENLENLEISNWSMDNLVDSSYMFAWCGKLKKLNLENWKMPKIRNLNSMFFSCENLNILNLGNWNMPYILETISMFYQCEKLNYLNLKGWLDIEVKTNIKQVFETLPNRSPIIQGLLEEELDCPEDIIEKLENLWIKLGFAPPISLREKIIWIENYTNIEK